MSELLQRQEADRRELISHQQNRRTRLEQEHRRETLQPPEGKSIADLRREHEAEKRDLKGNSQQERRFTSADTDGTKSNRRPIGATSGLAEPKTHGL
jgi:hypothetical protein